MLEVCWQYQLLARQPDTSCNKDNIICSLCNFGKNELLDDPFRFWGKYLLLLFSREEVSSLSPQQCMKYGSSPFYFECELMAGFYPCRHRDLSGNGHWFPVGTGEWASSRDGIWGLQPLPVVSTPFQQARVSLCSLWVRGPGAFGHWTCHGQETPPSSLCHGSPQTLEGFCLIDNLR